MEKSQGEPRYRWIPSEFEALTTGVPRAALKNTEPTIKWVYINLEYWDLENGILASPIIMPPTPYSTNTHHHHPHTQPLPLHPTHTPERDLRHSRLI